MSTTTMSGVAGWIVRIFVAVCFLGGALAAVSGRLIVAGVGFLVGHTFLAAAAVIQGQRRRGAGLSVLGVGWLSLAIGLGAGDSALPGTALLVAGFALVTLGTLLVLGALNASGSATDPEA